MKDPLERRYVDEMLRNAQFPVELQVSLVELGAIVAAMQLALRHPDFPLTVRAQVEDFLAKTIAAVGQHFPNVAEGWERGNDPDCHIPRERRTRR